MKQEFIVMDASIKYMNAQNPLDEGLMYTGEGWARGLNRAFKYETASLAIEKAQVLQKEAPVRVFMLQINGPQINFAEVKF